MRVNEIFYSLQGEGRFTGTAAVFVRLSGCNLRCSFCDTRHETYTSLTEDEIVRQVVAYPSPHVVITGGEPTLQLTQSLVDKLHEAGRFIQIETNGSIPLDSELVRAIDWITCSPKELPVKIGRVDELKVVYEGQDMTPYETMGQEYRAVLSLQPCDTGDEARNVQLLDEAVCYIQAHPQWRLSLQTHKLIHIP
ncbi:radical SAM protein [Barnesiella sp. An55]|uniref:7-carboxy-7-deazaguanine synthase QueE n=1 Tax=Barnesiella sp. An55 TaxID=1965646 RepID=UPI000B3927E9|nr:radical SAM protein [Barnesiella sp. An55]OUN74829.1 7-carboxy-7-deazaguanine synthase [Barnesiella sp. An55]HIZ25803.1 7-carboxy-7-deazaguanine synthase QueE [Candidatus Barnesiella merdipullorum]